MFFFIILIDALLVFHILHTFLGVILILFLLSWSEKRVRQRKSGNLGLCCTSLFSHDIECRLGDHHQPPTHTHTQGAGISESSSLILIWWVVVWIWAGSWECVWRTALVSGNMNQKHGKLVDLAHPGPTAPSTWRSSDPRRSANDHQLIAVWTCVPSLTRTHGPLEARHPFSLVPRCSGLTVNWACAKLINSHAALAITSSLWYHASVS